MRRSSGSRAPSQVRIGRTVRLDAHYPGTSPTSNAERGGRGSSGRSKIASNNPGRRMEHIASVSRSSGLEKGGDLLKESIVQEEFRAFIDGKLRTFWDSYGTSYGSPTEETESAQKQKRDSQENILILFRKLREGLSSSGRKDAFTFEVYETSLYLSVVFDSPVQTTSILSGIVPHTYSTPRPFCLITILILLLHQLVVSFPSQRTYLEQIKSLVPNLLELEQTSSAYLWISGLARSLRTSNFVQFERLSRHAAFEHLLPLSYSVPLPNGETPTMLLDLPRLAVHALVSRLRLKARDAAWTVFRNAYRELSSSDETQVWLGKRLFFDNFGCEATALRFDEWVRERCRDGQLRPKEGVEGRWMVCKAR